MTDLNPGVYVLTDKRKKQDELAKRSSGASSSRTSREDEPIFFEGLDVDERLDIKTADLSLSTELHVSDGGAGNPFFEKTLIDTDAHSLEESVSITQLLDSTEALPIVEIVWLEHEVDIAEGGMDERIVLGFGYREGVLLIEVTSISGKVSPTDNSTLVESHFISGSFAFAEPAAQNESSDIRASINASDNFVVSEDITIAATVVVTDATNLQEDMWMSHVVVVYEPLRVDESMTSDFYPPQAFKAILDKDIVVARYTDGSEQGWVRGISWFGNVKWEYAPKRVDIIYRPVYSSEGDFVGVFAEWHPVWRKVIKQATTYADFPLLFVVMQEQDWDEDNGWVSWWLFTLAALSTDGEVVWSTNFSGTAVEVIAVTPSRLMVKSYQPTDNTTHVYVMRPQTGQVLWSVVFAEPFNLVDGDFHEEWVAIIAGQTAYLYSQDGAASKIMNLPSYPNAVQVAGVTPMALAGAEFYHVNFNDAVYTYALPQPYDDFHFDQSATGTRQNIGFYNATDGVWDIYQYASYDSPRASYPGDRLKPIAGELWLIGDILVDLAYGADIYGVNAAHVNVIKDHVNQRPVEWLIWTSSGGGGGEIIDTLMYDMMTHMIPYLVDEVMLFEPPERTTPIVATHIGWVTNAWVVPIEPDDTLRAYNGSDYILGVKLLDTGEAVVRLYSRFGGFSSFTIEPLLMDPRWDGDYYYLHTTIENYSREAILSIDRSGAQHWFDTLQGSLDTAVVVPILSYGHGKIVTMGKEALAPGDTIRAFVFDVDGNLIYSTSVEYPISAVVSFSSYPNDVYVTDGTFVHRSDDLVVAGCTDAQGAINGLEGRMACKAVWIDGDLTPCGAGPDRYLLDGVLKGPLVFNDFYAFAPILGARTTDAGWEVVNLEDGSTIVTFELGMEEGGLFDEGVIKLTLSYYPDVEVRCYDTNGGVLWSTILQLFWGPFYFRAASDAYIALFGGVGEYKYSTAVWLLDKASGALVDFLVIPVDAGDAKLYNMDNASMHI